MTPLPSDMPTHLGPFRFQRDSWTGSYSWAYAPDGVTLEVGFGRSLGSVVEEAATCLQRRAARARWLSETAKEGR